MTDPPAGPDYPQGSPQPGDKHPGPINGDRHKLAGVTLRAAARRIPREIEAADLTVPGGDMVQIVCLVDVMDWLEGMAVRVEAGEPL